MSLNLRCVGMGCAELKERYHHDNDKPSEFENTTWLQPSEVCFVTKAARSQEGQRCPAFDLKDLMGGWSLSGLSCLKPALYSVLLQKLQKLTPVLGMKVKQGKKRNLIIYKTPLRITISMESSRRDLFIDRVVGKFILKNNLITVFPWPSYPKPEWNYLEHGLLFTVHHYQDTCRLYLGNILGQCRRQSVFLLLKSDKKKTWGCITW